jgi:SPP1 gp7 family putative phage head morphogenesis protein
MRAMTEIIAKRKWRYPLSYERSYAKLLRDYVRRKCKVIQAFLPELQDAVQSPSAVNARIEIVMDGIEKAVENAEMMTTSIQYIFDLVSRYNQTEFDAITKSLFGAPLSGSQPPAGIHQDAEIDDLKEMWVNQNLDLIKSIDQQTLQRLKQAMNEAILNNVDKRLLMKYLVDELQKIAGLEESRAVLIGTDQVGKLNGMLSRYRQENAGIDSYIWETCHDSRVRPSHADRQGHKYKWSNPPPGGHPGMPIRCRCVALPVIDLDKIPIRPKNQSYVTVGSPMDFMAHHQFKPSLAKQVDTIKVGSEATGGPYTFEVRRVTNSKFSLYAEADISPRANVIRTIEPLLQEAYADVAGELGIPTVVIADLEERFKGDIIGGFDKKSGKLFLSSHYDTWYKILAYIKRRNEDGRHQFANQTVQAVILHELGHKFYYDTIKKISKIKNLSYNKSRELVDSVVRNWVNELLLQDKSLDRALSIYAEDGIRKGSQSEVVAEAFSGRKTNLYARDLISRLKGLMTK